MSDNSLSSFLRPSGVVVVGASQDSTKLGYGLARNLLQSNYNGALHFVNPRGGALLGRPIYERIQDVPDPAELAVLLIPASGVPDALEACGERGIRAVIIGSGGFGETGPAGAALEHHCLELARQFDLRLMGPNCIGLLDTHLPINATFLPPPMPLAGDVAFISHSGAICAAVIDWARGQGFGLSRLVSLGNQVDINETDLLGPVAADPHTKVLTMYLEGVRDGRRFLSEAAQITRKKPIIALKVGRYAAGRRAVASHTGALAGEENAFSAAFRRAGVIRADSSEELFDWARALAWCPPPRGRSVAVLTNAGGPGVTAADALEANGLKLANLSRESQSALAAVLPAAASLRNPVDMLASASPEQYAACLKILLTDSGVDAVMLMMAPPPMFTAGAMAKATIPVIHNADKPVVWTVMGERLIQEAVEHFRASHVPEYRFPERAASALAVLAERAEYLQRAGDQPVLDLSLNQEAVSDLLKSVAPYGPGISPLPDAWLPQDYCLKMLETYNIPTARLELARSAEQAVELARQMGLDEGTRFVLKIASMDLQHKSDVGGILLGLNSPAAIANGFDKLVRDVKAAAPQARLLGAYIQPMAPPGQEVILGAVRDPQFGPLVMFGSGGIEVEGLKDVAFALAPLSQSEAEWMLEQTWAGRKLKGYRSLAAVDRQAVVRSLLRLAQLVYDFPQIMEIEINPLRVFGSGALTLDARCRIEI